MSSRRLVLACACAVAILATAPAARADTGVSSNWSGFAIHAPSVTFRRVFAEWTQPRARCRRGHPTYSAAWVGIGGFAPTAQGLEQVGTELDCDGSGRSVSSAWYELIPAPSEPVHLRVSSGDAIAATVILTGHQVELGLADLTRHTSFQRTVYAPSIDDTSAEWIVEAPSECANGNSCQTLPLANFGTARFSSASAQSSAGHTGTISDRAWRSTKILLRPGGRRFVVYNGTGSAAGGARPSRLGGGGSSFTVRFVRVASTRSVYLSPLQPIASAGYIVH